MNIADLHHKLIAAARRTPPDESVPYAFEKRVTARLRSAPDHWGFWAAALWRAAVPCCAIMMFLALWTFFVPAPPAPNVDLSQQMERTVLAAAAQDQGAELVW